MRLRASCGMALIAVSAVTPAALASSFPRFGSQCSRADFISSGLIVRAELCRASSAGGRAVVVLHGCGGFSTFDHRLVSELPHYGISTLDVDYFGPTPSPRRRGFCGGARWRGGDPFPVWVRAARDAAAALRATRGVDPSGVGVVGWSLGGGVALAAAQGLKGLRPFDAVAGFSTGGFGDSSPRSIELPPTILLSAGRTDAIPLAETLPLYRAIRRAHIPSALFVYPRGSHEWPHSQGTIGIKQAALFLRRFLR
ncbi:MAG: dienelactone hydrolase family protein [Gaiellaceae bacterium]